MHYLCKLKIRDFSSAWVFSRPLEPDAVVPGFIPKNIPFSEFCPWSPRAIDWTQEDPLSSHAHTMSWKLCSPAQAGLSPRPAFCSPIRDSVQSSSSVLQPGGVLRGGKRPHKGSGGRGKGPCFLREGTRSASCALGHQPVRLVELTHWNRETPPRPPTLTHHLYPLTVQIIPESLRRWGPGQFMPCWWHEGTLPF